MSGLQIFNAHPHLYWGIAGANSDQAFFSVDSQQKEGVLQGYIHLGQYQLNTTGVLGASLDEQGEMVERAFPYWITLPGWQDLGEGRHWHFLAGWLLVLNGIFYLSYGFWHRHIQQDLLPVRQQLMPKYLWYEVVAHMKLRFPQGEEARRYNALQKIAYLLVIFILLPIMIMTGLTMSPAMDAAFPFLPDIFGGRSSARSLHFITATLLILFTVLHIAMVLLSGVGNNLRSMITGYYAIESEGNKDEK